MTKETIYEAWKKGFRTRKICTVLAADFFGSGFREREYPDMSEEHALQIAYGEPNALYGAHTAIECMYYAYVSFENENTLAIHDRMEAIWDNNLHVKRFSHKFQKHYKVVTEESSNTINHKVFTFEYESEDGCWCSRERASRAVVIIDGSNISMLKVQGVDPTLGQATAMCIAAASRAVSIHKYTRDGRVHPFRINYRRGYSDCEDYFLDLYGRENNVFYKKYTAAKLHVSMAGKVSSITDMYVGDAIELFIAAMGYRDFDYFKSRISKRYGVRFVRPYRNEILSEEDMDFIPKERHCRRPSRR